MDAEVSKDTKDEREDNFNYFINTERTGRRLDFIPIVYVCR